MFYNQAVVYAKQVSFICNRLMPVFTFGDSIVTTYDYEKTLLNFALNVR